MYKKELRTGERGKSDECISGLFTAANRVAPHLTGPPASLVM